MLIYGFERLINLLLDPDIGVRVANEMRSGAEELSHHVDELFPLQLRPAPQQLQHFLDRVGPRLALPLTPEETHKLHHFLPLHSHCTIEVFSV
jgi:hypothetical protein